MKKTLQLLLALFTFTYASAQTVGDTFTEGDYNYTVTSVSPNEAELSGSTLTELVVPSTATDSSSGFSYSIVAVGENAFHEIPVTSVVLPSTVKTIKLRAFRKSGLTSINLENVVTLADKDTFSECKLTEVDLSNVTYIGRFTFNNNRSLPSIEIPVAETIADGAFRKCVFTEIVIPSSVTTIGSTVFEECNNLKSIQLEWGAESIVNVSASDIFKNITDPSLINVYVPIGTSASYTGTGWDVATIVEGTIPEPTVDGKVGDVFTVGNIDYTVTSIDPLEAEVSGSTLAEVVIPETVTDDNTSTTYTVTAVGKAAFKGDVDAQDEVAIPVNRTLTSVVLPSTVTLLKADAFTRCQTLESINLENVVTLESYNVFFDCPKLTEINLASAVDIGRFAFHGLGNSTLTSIKISNAVNLYKAAFRTSKISSINIPSSVSFIDSQVFMGCSALTEVQVNWENSETIPAIDVTQDTEVDGEIVAGNATFYNVNTANVTLLVPAGTKTLYEGLDGWKDFNVVEGVLSTEDIVNDNLNIQVSAEVLTVNSSSTFTNGNLSIYDITGRVLSSTALNRSSVSVNISNLASGIYIAKVTEGNAKLVKRFVKQ